jgi:predicted nucleic acid-binding Zn ribbon protein
MSMSQRRRRTNHGERAHASEVVSSLMSRHVPRDQVRLSRVRDAWEQMATATVAARAWPAAVSGDELLIDVHDNQWLHELTYLRQSLLDRIREHCPAAQIGRIRLRIGPVPARSPRPAETAEARPESILAPEPSEDTRSALDSVTDPDLRNLLAGTRVALGRTPSQEG